MSKNLTGQIWRNIAKSCRDKIKDPHKPSSGELRLYERRLKVLFKKGCKRALILGATPGVRDLLAKHGFETTVCDINPNMIRAMTAEMKFKNKRREKIVVANWLTMPFKENSFDLVLADHSCSNVEFKYWPTLLKSIVKVLKPGGYHLHNVVLKLNDGLMMAGLIKKYRHQPKFFKNYKNLVWYQYRVWTHDSKFYNNKNYCSNWNAFDRYLKKMVREGQLLVKDFETVKMGLGAFKVYFPPKKIVDSLFRKYYKIISISYNKKHPVYRRYQLYLMKVKK